MSYTPTTDFPAMLRQTSGGVRTESVPGLDFVVAAMARAGFFALSVGQTAPTSNQTSTAWFKPAQPSWSAEGTLYLWNAATSEYEQSSQFLWRQFLAPSGYAFQSAVTANNVVTAGVSLFAVQRVAPVATAVVLPNLTAQFVSGRKLQIIDFSTNIANHTITLNTPDGATIMQRSALQMLSTADSLAGVTLTPSPDLSSWIIAP